MEGGSAPSSRGSSPSEMIRFQYRMTSVPRNGFLNRRTEPGPNIVKCTLVFPARRGKIVDDNNLLAHSPGPTSHVIVVLPIGEREEFSCWVTLGKPLRMN